MEIYILDVGKTMYGDCILITHNDTKILIDGAHPGDDDLITSQLSSILKQEAPFSIDLLVVTHCHVDHIGCLPALIKNETIVSAMALVADEKLGFGRTPDGDGPADDNRFTKCQKVLATLLQEEDHSSMTNTELEKFIEDGVTLESRYIQMLNKLEESGSKLIRYGSHKKSDLQQLEQKFSEVGLKILGPTLEHLTICASAIAGTSDFVSQDMLATDEADVDDILDAYRKAARQIFVDDIGSEDMRGPGAAKNNQSIVIKVSDGKWSALLAGDMQFAEPEVTGLNDNMLQLRKVAKKNGPYDFIKLTHHTSYNGTNEEVLNDFLPTAKNLAHTGGRNDGGHPNKEVLKTLKKHAQEFDFARNDRNGLITVTKDGKVRMDIEKGNLNNFNPNAQPDAEVETSGKLSPRPELPAEKGPVAEAGREVNQRNDYVDIHAKIPNEKTTVTITLQIDPEKKKVSGLNTPKPNLVTDFKKHQLANGRKVPSLLFVTNKSSLEKNIGQEECNAVFSIVQQNPSMTLLDLPDNLIKAENAAILVRKKLTDIIVEGVVIIGGYDVVPAQILDTLDKSLRDKLAADNKANRDADSFIVWSDDIYGRKNASTSIELPVSRIPDGKSAEVVLNSLGATLFNPGTCFGLRNLFRPFANDVFNTLPNVANKILVSEKISPKDIQSDSALGAVYFMLHGADQEGSLFWGETENNELYEAVSLQNIPQSSVGTIVFAGCCWGALTVYQKASRLRPQIGVTPKVAEDSIAISYLKAGALAFVGCTGSHYSPTIEPYNYYGKPMHEHFWKGVAEGKPPAMALFDAKKEYAKKIPHEFKDSLSRAIEMKILKQFTCLGLGW